MQYTLYTGPTGVQLEDYTSCFRYERLTQIHPTPVSSYRRQCDMSVFDSFHSESRLLPGETRRGAQQGRSAPLPPTRAARFQITGWQVIQLNQAL
jgi:hypothetical protein